MTTRARMLMNYTSSEGHVLYRMDEVFIEKTYWVGDEGTIEVADLYHTLDLHGTDYRVDLKAVPTKALVEIPEASK